MVDSFVCLGLIAVGLAKKVIAFRHVLVCECFLFSFLAKEEEKKKNQRRCSEWGCLFFFVRAGHKKPTLIPFWIEPHYGYDINEQRVNDSIGSICIWKCVEHQCKSFCKSFDIFFLTCCRWRMLDIEKKLLSWNIEHAQTLIALSELKRRNVETITQRIAQPHKPMIIFFFAITRAIFWNCHKMNILKPQNQRT